MLIAAVVFASWVLALARTIHNLIAIPRLRPDGHPPEPFPLVSIIVPARDEERIIERTVRSLLAQNYPAFEVIVVDDRSTDRTGEILDSIAASDPHLRVIHGVEPPEGWLGKPWALHQGSRIARGEMLLFVDADIIYSPKALAAAVSFMQRRGVRLLSLFPNVEMKGIWEHAMMPQLAFMAFVILPTWMGNRSKATVLAIGGGPGNLIRRDMYDEVGGHEALRDAVVDDVALARQVRRRGHQTLFVLANRLISMRMYEGFREIITGFTKNFFVAFGGSLFLAIVLTLATVLFHIVPFVWAGLGVFHLLAGLPVSTTEWLGIGSVAFLLIIRLVLFAALRYPIWAALLLHPLMAAADVYLIARSAWFSGVKRQIIWRGRVYDARKTRFGGE